MYTRRKLLIFNKELRHKHILIQQQKWLWYHWVPTNFLHQPPPRFSIASCVQCGGTPTQSPVVPKGNGKCRTDASPSDVSGQFLLRTPGVFLSQSAFLLPRSCCPSQSCMLPSCPPLSSPLAPGTSSLFWDFFGGLCRLLNCHPWALLAHRHLPEHQSGCPVQCQALGCGVAVDSPGPSTQKLLWGWREEQAGSKNMAGRQRGLFRLLSAA